MDVTTLLLILSAVIAATAVIAFVSRRAKAVDAIEQAPQAEELRSAPARRLYRPLARGEV